MANIKRTMKYKDGRIIDFLAKPTILEVIRRLGGDSEFIISSDIKLRTKEFSGMTSRIIRLVNQNYLLKKGIKSDGAVGRPLMSYKLSPKSLLYLKKYRTFLNEDGWLTRKEKEDVFEKPENNINNQEVVVERIKVIRKETQSKPTITISQEEDEGDF